jgi:hypothetical protein
MTISEGMAWFKKSFGGQVDAALAGTPFSADLLTAIAVQESYECWGGIFKTRPLSEVLKLCVGDTLDASGGRTVFPVNKAQLLASSKGDAMFAIARQALLDVGSVNAVYHKLAASNPDKFCHAFGIFQYDIQYFPGNPDFFLNQRWYDFGACLNQCLAELRGALAGTYGASKTALTDDESVYVAIAYNTGPKHTHVGAGYKQGHESDGVFYGESIAQYLDMAHNIP